MATVKVEPFQDLVHIICICVDMSKCYKTFVIKGWGKKHSRHLFFGRKKDSSDVVIFPSTQKIVNISIIYLKIQ